MNAHISLVDAVIDRFGMDVEFTPFSEGIFTFTVPVTLSPGFYGWVVSFGGRMKITAPLHALYGIARAGTKCAHRNIAPSYIRTYYSGI